MEQCSKHKDRKMALLKNSESISLITVWWMARQDKTLHLSDPPKVVEKAIRGDKLAVRLILPVNAIRI